MKSKVWTRIKSSYPNIQQHQTKYFVLHSISLILSAIFFSVLLTSVAPWRSIQIIGMCSIIVIAGIMFWLLKGYFRGLSIGISLIFLTLTIATYQYYFSINHSKNYPTLNISTINSQNRFQPLRDVEHLEIEDIEKLIRQENQEGVLIDNADILLDNKFKFYKYQEHVFTGNIDWSADPYSDPSWNWNLHNMGYIAVLVKAYKKSNNLEYLLKAEQFILAWISDNSAYYIAPPSEYSWNDHSTAFRLLNYIFFADMEANRIV